MHYINVFLFRKEALYLVDMYTNYLNRCRVAGEIISALLSTLELGHSQV